MLPKVIRDDTSISVTATGTTGGEGTSKVRMLSATINSGGRMSGSNGKSIRRPISTKSAHVTNIPLEPSFLSPSTTHAASPSRPYLPYSPVSPRRTSRQNSHRVQQEQETTGSSSSSTRWKGGQHNGYGFKGEHRARAHSHKNFQGKTWGGTRGPPGTVPSDSKSMPYLVPKSGRQRSASSSALPNKQTPLSSNQQQVKEEKVITKPEELQTTAMQLVGGGIVTGTTGSPVVGMNVSGGPASSSLTKDRVQVCRTKEEREKNPDSIRLDKRGVRVFPDIGGGESTTLKLLSLQHNLITRLENVPLLSQLVVLDLYDNRVERITGLQGLPSLRVLLLGKNRIKRIEGLESLKRLEILDLHGNQLRYVDNLAPLSALRVLNLAGNLLRNIRNLGPYGMSSLTELNIKRNRIKNLDGLQKAPHLKKLLIANNDLPNISSLAPLRKLFYLNELVIDPNPLVAAVGSEYQNQVLTLFPNLGSLDRNLITDDMKLQAKLWHKKKLQEEEARKQEEERLRQEMAASVGPPGSREQVIYQARRRWESVKNFVKSNGSTAQEPETGSSLKITKSAMKSVKKVVTVVTEVKAQKRVELLYPPSTLDLEEFPDGQQKLDQMESMISSQIVQKYTPPQIEKRLDRDSSPAPLQSITEPGISRFTPIVSKVVLTVSPRENGYTTNTTELEINSAMIRNTSIIREESGEDASLTIDTIDSILLSNDLPSASNEKEEVQQQEIQFLENQCSARSNSAKVAVVRPLVRSEIISKHETDAASKRSTDIHASCSQIEIPNSTTTSGTTLNEVNDLTDKIEGQGVENTQCSTSFEENLIPTKGPVNGQTILQEPLAIPQIPSDKDQNLDQGTVPQTVVQNEASRVKAKLLKHLRSISLDSYPHPFLRPDGHKPGDASSINSGSPMIPSDDDDGGEEDDDNDDEVVQDYEDDDAYSIATSTGTSGSTPRRSNTVVATTNRLLKNGMFRKQIFPRTKSQRIKFRDRSAKLFGSTSDLSPRPPSGATSIKRVNSGTGTRGGDSTSGSHSGRTFSNGRVLRRCDSAASLSTSGLSSLTTTVGIPTSSSSNSLARTTVNNGQTGSDADNQSGTSAFRKQGMDFLVEVEGKMLNVFGQGGLRHALTAFASNVTCHVNTAKFHYISYDSIIPFFGKLRQVYPSLEHFHFRANNLCTLAQLDALSDLQGLTSLFIAKEGNPIVNHDAWAHYSSYRLSHWGLQVINGKEVCSEYRGGASPAAQAKGFESLGFLALSCLPQTALTPLAKRLHMLHCFCCCSPSTSSDESNRKLTVNQQRHSGLLQSSSQTTTDHGSNGNFCTAWDDDPVLLDVIGKEALVYCPPTLSPEIDVNDNHPTSTALSLINKPEVPTPPTFGSSSSHEKKRAETLGNLVNSGVEIVEKVDMLEKVWPTLLTKVIQDMLMDFRYMDQYMKKEIKKAQDITLINQQQHQHSSHHHSHNQHGHGRKFRH